MNRNNELANQAHKLYERVSRLALSNPKYNNLQDMALYRLRRREKAAWRWG